MLTGEEECPGSSQVKLAESRKIFLLFSEWGPSQEEMEMDHDGSPSPRDHYMLDVGGLFLKPARSPPRPAKMSETLVVVAHGPSLDPSMLGDAGPSGEQKGDEQKGAGGASLVTMPQSMVMVVVAGKLFHIGILVVPEEPPCFSSGKRVAAFASL